MSTGAGTGPSRCRGQLCFVGQLLLLSVCDVLTSVPPYPVPEVQSPRGLSVPPHLAPRGARPRGTAAARCAHTCTSPAPGAGHGTIPLPPPGGQRLRGWVCGSRVTAEVPAGAAAPRRGRQPRRGRGAGAGQRRTKPGGSTAGSRSRRRARGLPKGGRCRPPPAPRWRCRAEPGAGRRAAPAARPPAPPPRPAARTANMAAAVGRDTLPEHWSYGVCRDGRVFFIE